MVGAVGGDDDLVESYEYNKATGQLIAKTDPAGHKTEFEFDAATGRQTYVKYPEAGDGFVTDVRTVEYQYTSTGQIQAIKEYANPFDEITSQTSRSAPAGMCFALFPQTGNRFDFSIFEPRSPVRRI